MSSSHLFSTLKNQKKGSYIPRNKNTSSQSKEQSKRCPNNIPSLVGSNCKSLWFWRLEVGRRSKSCSCSSRRRRRKAWVFFFFGTGLGIWGFNGNGKWPWLFTQRKRREKWEFGDVNDSRHRHVLLTKVFVWWEICAREWKFVFYLGSGSCEPWKQGIHCRPCFQLWQDIDCDG